ADPHAAVRLDHGVVRALLRVGPDVAEAGDRRVDEIVPPEIFVPDSETVRDARAPVLDDDVARRREAPNDVATLRRVEVHRDATLAPVADLVQRADAVDLHTDPAADVADPRSLDLHHVRALVGEDGGRVRPRRRDRQVEHPDARQRPTVAHANSFR